MGIHQQVILKSDRRSRGLILVFCLAPVVVPVLTMIGKWAMDEHQRNGWPDWPQALSSSAQAFSPAAPPKAMPASLGSLPSREDFPSVIFAAPSGGAPNLQWSSGESWVAKTPDASPEASPDLNLRRLTEAP